MFPSSLQKRETLWAEQVAEIKLLEEKARQHGTRLQSVLQVRGILELVPRWEFLISNQHLQVWETGVCS
jgi:hypothetical protein